jgi:hypothetical protein
VNEEFLCRKTWVVQFSSEELTSNAVIIKGHEFYLEPFLEGGKTHFYTLRFEEAKMNASLWKDLKLFPAGTADLVVKELPPIKPFPDTPPQYKIKMNEVIQKLDVDRAVRRLEGVITVGAKPHVVRILCFPGAQTNGRDWMVLEIRDTRDHPPLGGASPAPAGEKRQNGTVHGDPK